MELLSRISPVRRRRPCTLQPSSLATLFTFPAILDPASDASQSRLTHTGHAKMIYDRLPDLYPLSLSPPFAGRDRGGAGFSREHLHHLEASGMYHSPGGGFRSEWVTARAEGARHGGDGGALQPRRNARIYYALQPRGGGLESGPRCISNFVRLRPVDFSPVINSRGSSPPPRAIRRDARVLFAKLVQLNAQQPVASPRSPPSLEIYIYQTWTLTIIRAAAVTFEPG